MRPMKSGFNGGEVEYSRIFKEFHVKLVRSERE